MKRIIKNSLLTLLIFTTGIFVFAQPYRISGDCMEPAVKDGNLYFLNRVSHWINPYQKGDIILFKYENKIWISRIVALENDSIQISKNSIDVNGLNLSGNVSRNWTNWEYGHYGIHESVTIPKSHVYVLSDNLSAHHDDSRIFGPIAKSDIIGKIWK